MAIVLCSLFIQCAQARIGNSIDSSSHANIEEIASEHVALNFAVDFDSSKFIGNVTHTMKLKQDYVEKAVFDIAGIDVKDVFVRNKDDWRWSIVSYDIQTPFPKLGSALIVPLPSYGKLLQDDEVEISIHYETNEKTTAINWLKPSQTAGKKLPYLFTQCEDIACRSVAPLQDTPANKITYEAVVLVKNEFKVFMSANSTSITHVNTTHDLYEFRNAIPMASYLIAIAVGDLEYKSLGDRSGVITEPSQMDAVAAELESLPDLLQKAEAYLTPYIWGTYSIIVLPPSFPMGGMENPLLTFASPTIITGDKSQVYVATHEIAHSWTGNDVTCENWSNMWLNEGFTVFEERKVSALIYGEDFSKVNAFLGNISMYEDMKTMGLSSSYASLYPVVKDDLPDNSFSEIPYEKGFQLLYYIETLIGADLMQQLIRTHILQHQQQSVAYEQFEMVFEDFVDDNFDADKAKEIKAAMDWETWVKQPGLAPVKLDFTTPALTESQKLADDYIQGAGQTSPSNYKDYTDKFLSNLRVVFHEKLIAESKSLTLDILKKVDADLNVIATVDPEVKQRWYPLGIRMGYDAVTEPAHQLVSTQGRLKYLTPVYQALIDAGKLDVAKQWFKENEDFYHPAAVTQIQRLIDGAEPKKAALEFSLSDMGNVIAKADILGSIFGLW